MDNPVDRVHPWWTRAGSNGPPWSVAAWIKGTGAQWCAHQSLASGHSGAWKLAGEDTTERGEHGEPGSSLTGARALVWRPGNGGEMVVERKLGNSGAQASKEEESEMGEVRCSTTARRPIYRARGRSAEAGNSGNGRR
jgi:hypothetical protein